MGGEIEQKGGGTKILKGGQAGARGGCLKKGEAGTPLRTMKYFQQRKYISSYSMK